MASITFYGLSAGSGIDNTNGSGIGFYNGSFGASIPVGDFPGRTFMTNSNGTLEGPELNNVKYTASNSGLLGQSGSSILLTQIPNYLSTLNIRFDHSSAVAVSNASLRIFDRNNINNDPSGVTCYVAEIIHPDSVQNNNGSGDATWINAYGSGSTVGLVNSPGTSGLSPSGSSTSDTRHDWYVAISASADSVGNKTFGLYISLEYL